MAQERSKSGIYEQLARLGKAVGSAPRLELLDLLSQGPRTVEALASAAKLPLANASQHLQVLRAVRLVESDRRGTFVEYRIADDRVERFFLALRELAESRLDELGEAARAYLGDTTIEPIDRERLLRRVREGEVTVIDVRPSEEYRAGHVPGALCVPLPELKKRLAELPRGREIVAYCRGPYCVLAVEAVELLRKRGFDAHRMEEGVADLRARGWQIETGPSA
ncbi:MAG TPA: metalloregulator ArsR/SmtB family transcription factor [Nannocystaceae bacterium]|nr:metalloregulator ArsR/SmtB family transcription factor [Nannocystaceae bacterium]